MKLTVMETRIVAFVLLAVGIAFVILASISYISNGSHNTPDMADEPTEIISDTTTNHLESTDY